MRTKAKLITKVTSVTFCDICGREIATLETTIAEPWLFHRNTPWSHLPRYRMAEVCMYCYDQYRNLEEPRQLEVGWCDHCKRYTGQVGGTCPYCKHKACFEG